MGAGGAYALASLGIMLSNKIVLSTFGFPSANVLCVLQCAVTVGVLAGRGVGDGQLRRMAPRLTRAAASEFWGVARGLFPLQLLFCINASSGLGSTRRLSVPMMACLRRFSIVMTMLGEHHWLGRSFSPRVVASVAVMIAGAVVAAIDDLAFDAAGYALVCVNNVATASFAVVTGVRMAGRKGDHDGPMDGSHSSSTLMLHNSLFCLLCLPLTMACTGELGAVVRDLAAFPAWKDPLFLASFGLSVCAGIVFNHALLACIQANGPTTTAVIGLLKNVAGTFIGMLPFLPGYHYSPLNFLGVSVSMAGGVAYGVAKLGGKQAPQHEDPKHVAGDGGRREEFAGKDRGDSPTTVLVEVKVTSNPFSDAV